MGSQSGGNAQILSLMSKYNGGSGGGTAKRGTDMPTKAGLQSSFDSWMHDRLGQGGFNGVFGFPEAMGRGGGGGNGGGGNQKPPTTTTDPATEEPAGWQFPQYTQTWAFTPPTPTPLVSPGVFDTSKYGNPLNKKNIKKNT